MKQFTKIGYISKSHKLNGAVRLVLKEYAFVSDAISPTFLFIEIENTPLPFFIEKIEIVNNKELIVKFEEFESRESAAGLKNVAIFIDEKEATHQCFIIGESIEDKLNFTGYDLYDENDNLIAKIEDVYFIPNNTLAAIQLNNEEVLLPLNEKLITNLDRKKKTVHLKIADGLFDLDHTKNEEEE